MGRSRLTPHKSSGVKLLWLAPVRMRACVYHREDKSLTHANCSNDVSKATLDYYTSALICMIGARQTASNPPPLQF
jgi:hypothetical protein